MERDRNEDLQIFRQRVGNELEIEGFVAKGFFSNGKCDWFKIGGRWSWVLNDNVELFYKKLDEKEIAHNYVSECEKNEEEIQEVWENIWEKSKNPIARSQYLDYWYDDDSRKISDCMERLKELQNKYWDTTEVLLLDDYEEQNLNDIDFENYKDKYIITVDYHY